MSIRTAEELEKLRGIGKIVRLALDKMTASVRSGITTAELDEIGVHVLAAHGAEAAPRKVYGFPGGACISVNDEAVHGARRPSAAGRRSRQVRFSRGEGRLLC